MCFEAALSGAQENPSNASTATGTGKFVYVPSTHTISYYVQHNVVGASAAHIHESPPGTNGSRHRAVHDRTRPSAARRSSRTPRPPTSWPGTCTRTFTRRRSGRRDSRADHAAGRDAVPRRHLTGAQEVGPTGSTATVRSVIFEPRDPRHQVRADAYRLGSVAAHIHQAPAGTNGAVIVPFTLVGQGASGTATLTVGQADALLNQGLLHERALGPLPGRRDPRPVAASRIVIR
jgi:hypothetical protein